MIFESYSIEFISFFLRLEVVVMNRKLFNLYHDSIRNKFFLQVSLRLISYYRSSVRIAVLAVIVFYLFRHLL